MRSVADGAGKSKPGVGRYYKMMLVVRKMDDGEVNEPQSTKIVSFPPFGRPIVTRIEILSVLIKCLLNLLDCSRRILK